MYSFLQFIKYIAFVALQSIFHLIVKGTLLFRNGVSFVVMIRRHVSHFLSLHFVSFCFMCANGAKIVQHPASNGGFLAVKGLSLAIYI